jgi:hypothetical protein
MCSPYWAEMAAEAQPETISAHWMIFNRQKSILPPLSLAKVNFSSHSSKTKNSSSLTSQNRSLDLHGCFPRCFFSFMFISAESLKNRCKSQKNRKIENPIVLHST